MRMAGGNIPDERLVQGLRPRAGAGEQVRSATAVQERRKSGELSAVDARERVTPEPRASGASSGTTPFAGSFSLEAVEFVGRPALLTDSGVRCRCAEPPSLNRRSRESALPRMAAAFKGAGTWPAFGNGDWQRSEHAVGVSNGEGAAEGCRDRREFAGETDRDGRFVDIASMTSLCGEQLLGNGETGCRCRKGEYSPTPRLGTLSMEGFML